MKTVTLGKLELFARVAEFGSLSKAALMLNTAPSVISRQLGMLEAECGARLFHRTGRGVTLTEFGERILPRSLQLIADAETLRSEINGSAGIPVGQVRVGVFAPAANTLLPALFGRLRVLYPGVTLRVFEGSAAQMDEWISNGIVDIAFSLRQGKSFAAHEHPLATSQSCLIGPADDPLMAGLTMEFDRLHRLPLILPGLPNEMRVMIEQIARDKSIEIAVVMEADSLNVLTGMVANHCGYTILPRHAVDRQLRDRLLTAAEIVNPRIDRTMTLMATTHRPLSLAAREVFRMVRGIAEGLTGY